MEGKRYHRLHSREVDLNHSVVVGNARRREALVFLGTTVCDIVLLGHLVGLPDRRETGRLGGHNVNAVTEINREVLHAGADELKHLVLDKAILECRTDERDSHVVGANALFGSARQIDEDYLGRFYIISVLKKLLYKLRATLADTHSAKRTVACVRVRAEYHLTAACKLLASVGVNNALICGNVYAAVFLSRRETEDVVVLVDSAAYGAERVVAVGHSVGDRELGHSARSCRLYDADIGYIVRYEGVEFDSQVGAVRLSYVMLVENRIRDSVLSCFCGGNRRSVRNFSVLKKDTVVCKLYHLNSPFEK